MCLNGPLLLPLFSNLWKLKLFHIKVKFIAYLFSCLDSTRVYPECLTTPEVKERLGQEK